MLKRKNLKIVIPLIIAFVLSSYAQIVSAAAISTALSDGWVIHQTDDKIDNSYRYGPSIIINPDNKIDAWFSSPGGGKFYSENYMTVGSTVPVALSGINTAAQKFYTNKPMDKISVCCPSWCNNIGNLTLSLYKWNTNYEKTIAGTPIKSDTFVNFTDNAWNELIFPSTQPAGYYLWVLSNPTETVGVWKYPQSNMTDNVNYFNGQVISGDYLMKIGYYVWDVIRYKSSKDGGHTWGSESIVLEPTIRSKDHFSVCDPGVIKVGQYYYIGYTSTENKEATDNEVYIARSISPTGPYEKWNGSGWGGNPQPFIKYHGIGSPTAYGAGEPSFILKDNTIYVYYTWRDNSNNVLTNQTRVSTAPANNPNWPGLLTCRGIAIDNGKDVTKDSADVKYIDTYGKFVALHTANRFDEKSYLEIFESTDGIHFSSLNMSTNNYLMQYIHNAGISGTETGHIDLSKNNFVAYAYGSKWAKWNTYLNPISYSNGSFFVQAPRSYASASSEIKGWSASSVLDSNNSSCWSSTQLSSTGTQWINIDMGQNYNVKRVRIYPRNFNGTSYCFPVDFKLQYSINGTIWSDIPGQNYTNYKRPTNTLLTFNISSPVSARYIRLFATRFSVDNYNSYYMQIAELNADY